MVHLAGYVGLPFSNSMVRGCFLLLVFYSPCMLPSSSIPALWPFLAIYVAWIRWIDKCPEHGTRLSPWFRSSKIWQYFAEYYPASCVSRSMSYFTIPNRPMEHGQTHEGELTSFASFFIPA